MDRSVPPAIALPDGTQVLHMDDSCLAVDKPAGLLCVPGRGPQKQDCLARRVQQQYADALVVHRLDMATSGVWLMARGAPMQRALGRAFEQQAVHKRYVAVVAGRVAPPASADGWGDIDLPIGADWPRRPLQQIDHERGRPSQTRWRILEAGARTTRLELMPRTGRSHQLRVHLKAIGHPILGDTLYAPPEVQALAPRLLLHACALRLAHPASGLPLEIDCPAPF